MSTHTEQKGTITKNTNQATIVEAQSVYEAIHKKYTKKKVIATDNAHQESFRSFISGGEDDSISKDIRELHEARELMTFSECCKKSL